MNRRARRAEAARARRSTDAQLAAAPAPAPAADEPAPSDVDDLVRGFRATGPRLTRTREREDIDRLLLALRCSPGRPATVIWGGEVVRTEDLIAAVMKRRAEIAPAAPSSRVTGDPIPDGAVVLASSGWSDGKTSILDDLRAGAGFMLGRHRAADPTEPDPPRPVPLSEFQRLAEIGRRDSESPELSEETRERVGQVFGVESTKGTTE